MLNPSYTTTLFLVACFSLATCKTNNFCPISRCGNKGSSKRAKERKFLSFKFGSTLSEVAVVVDVLLLSCNVTKGRRFESPINSSFSNSITRSQSIWGGKISRKVLFIISVQLFMNILCRSVNSDVDKGNSIFLITSKSLSRIYNNDRRLLWGFLQMPKSFYFGFISRSLFCISFTFFLFIRMEDQRLVFIWAQQKETFQWTKKTPTKYEVAIQ